jgi:hypothetical protein
MLSSQVVLDSSRIRENWESERGALVVLGLLFFFLFLLLFLIYFWFNYLSNYYQLALILLWLAMLHSSSLEVVFLRNYNIPMMMMKMLISICPVGRVRFRVSSFMSGYPL